jgi:hypothetical protein
MRMVTTLSFARPSGGASNEKCGMQGANRKVQTESRFFRFAFVIHVSSQEFNDAFGESTG